MEASAQQPRCRGGRQADLGGHRGQGRPRVPHGDSGDAQGRHVSSEPGATAVHPEGRRKAAAVGHPHGARPRGADGDEARHRAHLRGGLPPVQSRIPSQAQRNAGPGSHPQGGQPGTEHRGGRRHQGLLRQHRAADAVVDGGHANLGSASAEADPPVAGGRGDGGRRGAGSCGAMGNVRISATTSGPENASTGWACIGCAAPCATLRKRRLYDHR